MWSGLKFSLSLWTDSILYEKYPFERENITIIVGTYTSNIRSKRGHRNNWFRKVLFPFRLSSRVIFAESFYSFDEWLNHNKSLIVYKYIYKSFLFLTMISFNNLQTSEHRLSVDYQSFYLPSIVLWPVLSYHWIGIPVFNKTVEEIKIWNDFIPFCIDY